MSLSTWNMKSISIVALLFSAIHLGFSDVPRPRGVPISRASLYDPGKEFRCFDGSETIPFNYVNDDYCDCNDGSDEPGTSACTNGKFHCTNAGHKPLNIVSSRVNDGICDCCDGSDEFSGVISCSNNCKELGRQERDRLAKLKELESEGFNKKLELREEGKKLIAEKKERLTELENERTEAENKKTYLEAKKNEAEIPEKEAKEKHDKTWEEIKDKREEEKAQVKMDMAFKDLDENSDGKIDISEMSTHSEFDIDSNGVVSEEEAKEYMEGVDSANKEHFTVKIWPMIKDLYKPTYQTLEADANKSVDQVTTTEPNLTMPPPISPSDDDDDDDEEDDYGEEDEREDDDLDIPGSHGDIKPDDTDTDVDEDKMPDYDEATQQLIDAASDARTKFTEGEEEVRRIGSDITDINSFLNLDFGPDGDFATLRDQCFEYTDREYTYKLCPFDRGTQRPKNGGTETTLGNWERWDGIPENKYSAQKYERGQQCWNGPPRSIKVLFSCGTEHRLFSAAEPSRCEYQFEFETPCSCEEPRASDPDRSRDEL